MKQKEFGEADALISAYTKNFGKIEFLAKGARKINAKLAGLLQAPSLDKLDIVSNKIYHLTSATAINHFSRAKKNLEALEKSLLICELTDKLIKYPLKDELLWKTLLAALSKINENPKLAEKISILFQAKLIKILGYAPDQATNVVQSGKWLTPILQDKALQELFKNDKITDIEGVEKKLREYIERIANYDL